MNLDQNKTDAKIWDAEVSIDNNTVKVTLEPTHDIQKFEVDAQSKKLDLLAINNLIELAKANNYNECHIVLNTHGKAGSSDMNDEVITSVVKKLSLANIKITQLSVLQCNAFKINTAQDQRNSNRLASVHKVFHNKHSAMQILQGKLNHLQTEIEQSFHLVGFDEPYDPIEDKDAVIGILRNSSEENKSLPVTTIKTNKNQVREALESFENHLENSEKHEEKRQAAINVLSLEIGRRKGNIEECLKGGKDPSLVLTPKTLRLYKAVVGDQTPPRSSQEYHQQHLIWNKKNPFRPKTNELSQKLGIFREEENKIKDPEELCAIQLN